MADQEDNDEKRRVMTPPSEWGGDDSDNDPLAGDTSWLSEPDLAPAPDLEPAPGEDIADVEDLTASAPEPAEDQAFTANASSDAHSGSTEDDNEPAPTVGNATTESVASSELTAPSAVDDIPDESADDSTNTSSDASEALVNPMPASEPELTAAPALDNTESVSTAADSEKTSALESGDDDLGWLSADDLSGPVAETAPESLQDSMETPPAEMASSDGDTRDTDTEAESSYVPTPAPDTSIDEGWLADDDDTPPQAPATSSIEQTGAAVDTDRALDQNDDQDWIEETLAADSVSATITESTTPLSTSASAATSGSDREAAEALLTDHQHAGEGPRKLPIWPIFATVGALVLLGVGGYGAFTERTALQSQVSELKGQLAQKNRQGDLTPAEEQALKDDNQSLRLQLATMREQYEAVSDEIDRLQARVLGAVDAVDTVAETAPPADDTNTTEVGLPEQTATRPNTTESADTPPVDKPSAASDMVEVSAGTWFINVASYSREAMAEEWGKRVRDQVKNVVLQAVTVNGRDLYRVRAVGYSDKASAQADAKNLEQQYKIGPLWVGKFSAKEADELSATGKGISASSATRTDASAGQRAGAMTMAGVESGPDSESVSQPASQPDSQTDKALLSSLTRTASNDAGGWFIYVDTFSKGVDADNRAQAINAEGYQAKVAVEYRSGELFYRVQVVGIGSREEGERIVEELAQMGDMPNLQLRQY